MIGTVEFIVLVIVAVTLLKPDELAGYAKKLGKAVREVRKAFEDEPPAG